MAKPTLSINDLLKDNDDFQQTQRTRAYESRGYLGSKPQQRALRRHYSNMLKKYKGLNTPEAIKQKNSMRAARRAVNQQLNPKWYKRWPKNLLRWSGRQAIDAGKWAAKKGWKATKWTFKKAGQSLGTAWKNGRAKWDQRRQTISQRRTQVGLLSARQKQTDRDKLLPDPTAPAKDQNRRIIGNNQDQTPRQETKQILDRSLVQSMNRTPRLDGPRQGMHI